MQKPPHDDLKDALASCVDLAVPPSHSAQFNQRKDTASMFHPRFGGVVV